MTNAWPRSPGEEKLLESFSRGQRSVLPAKHCTPIIQRCIPAARETLTFPSHTLHKHTHTHPHTLTHGTHSLTHTHITHSHTQPSHTYTLTHTHTTPSHLTHTHPTHTHLTHHTQSLTIHNHTHTPHPHTHTPTHTHVHAHTHHHNSTHHCITITSFTHPSFKCLPLHTQIMLGVLVHYMRRQRSRCVFSCC